MSLQLVYIIHVICRRCFNRQIYGEYVALFPSGCCFSSYILPTCRIFDISLIYVSRGGSLIFRKQNDRYTKNSTGISKDGWTYLLQNVDILLTYLLYTIEVVA